MKRWYVVQVYAGFEELIKTDLNRRASGEELQDHFGEILVPSAKMKQLFSAQDMQDEQLFPGYMLVEMDVVPEVIRFVLSNPRVLRFLGGKEPIALSKEEVARVLGQVKGDVAITAKKSELVVGGEVTIKDGPFDGFVGVIDKVDEASEKLTVMVSIFGRMTPVELRFDQIKQ